MPVNFHVFDMAAEMLDVGGLESCAVIYRPVTPKKMDDGAEIFRMVDAGDYNAAFNYAASIIAAFPDLTHRGVRIKPVPGFFRWLGIDKTCAVIMGVISFSLDGGGLPVYCGTMNLDDATDESLRKFAERVRAEGEKRKCKKSHHSSQH